MDGEVDGEVDGDDEGEELGDDEGELAPGLRESSTKPKLSGSTENEAVPFPVAVEAALGP